ncbi:MAG: type II toxin-antitoxin system VapC family toxin [Jiangellaceae bacterium]
MMVLDASAVVALLLRSDAGNRVAERLGDTTDVVHVPHLMLVEVSQVLRRLVQAAVITPDRGKRTITYLRDIDAVRHAHERLLPRMWELRENLTACDATYVALAESLDAPLVTLDAKIAGAPGHNARVEVLAQRTA